MTFPVDSTYINPENKYNRLREKYTKIKLESELLAEENEKLKEQITILKKEIDDMITYAPGGQKYNVAKKRFDEMVSKQKVSDNNNYLRQKK